MAAILKYLGLNSRLLLLRSIDSNRVACSRCLSAITHKVFCNNSSIYKSHYAVLDSAGNIEPCGQNILSVNTSQVINIYCKSIHSLGTCVMSKYHTFPRTPVMSLSLRMFSSSADHHDDTRIVLDDDDLMVKDWLREMQDDFLPKEKDISNSYRSEIDTESHISAGHKHSESRPFSSGGHLYNSSENTQSLKSSSDQSDKSESSVSEATEIEDFSQTYDSYTESPEAVAVVHERRDDDIIDVTEDDVGESEEIAQKYVTKVSTERGVTGVFDIEELVSFLYAENGQDICVIAVPEEYNYVDYMVLVSGISPRHNKAIAKNLQWHYKRKCRTSDNASVKVEGLLTTTEWLAIDLGNIALHIFKPETREMYDLETLWTVGPEYDEKTNEVSVDPFAFQYSLDIFDSHQQNIPGLGSISVDRGFTGDDVSVEERFTEDMRPMSDRQDMMSSSRDNSSVVSQDRNMSSSSDTVNESDSDDTSDSDSDDTSDSESSSDSESDTNRR